MGETSCFDNRFTGGAGDPALCTFLPASGL